jgi:hypothetical protein
MNKGLPLKKLLSEKEEPFRDLFIKTMNLHLGPQIGTPLSEKDRQGRVRKALEESIKKGK